MTKSIRCLLLLVLSCLFANPTWAFVGPIPVATISAAREKPVILHAAEIDYNVVSLVIGQENYGLGVVCLGEALYSFLQAPTLGNAARVFLPTVVAALVLFLVSGPMVTSGEPSQMGAGLGIATLVSIGLGASYAFRLAAPVSAAPKEIAGLGLLVAIAGFFSFTQNLVVDGFVALPSIPLPSLPSLPSADWGDDEFLQ
jgi:hypothetical protein